LFLKAIIKSLLLQAVQLKKKSFDKIYTFLLIVALCYPFDFISYHFFIFIELSLLPKTHLVPFTL